jgi:hypothetical protein
MYLSIFGVAFTFSPIPSTEFEEVIYVLRAMTNSSQTVE